jgi:hypothetical protein
MVLVLWQLLLPGYILTLDMVFGPHAIMPSYTGIDIVSFPLSYLLYIAQLLMPAWEVEKIVLCVLWFAMFYVPLRWYPLTRIYGIEYLGSVLFAINPFVYERMLAGQWRVLAGYVCVYILMSLLIQSINNRSLMAYALPLVILMGICTPHMALIGIVMVAVWKVLYVSQVMIARRYMPFRFSIRQIGIIVISILYICLWLLSVYMTPHNTTQAFNHNDLVAFSTATDTHVGTVGNVMMLYGFWGEHEHWRTYFVIPKDAYWWTWLALSAMGIVICVGLVRVWQESRRMTILLTSTLLLSITCAVGIGESPLQYINQWLYDHVPLWIGLRDSTKWLVCVVSVYALLFSHGSLSIVSRVAAQYRRIFVWVFCMLPFLYTPTLLFALGGQLHTTWYPTEWYTVNKILTSTHPCRAIFLPWHGYYTPRFNDFQLVGNTAPAFFDCDVVISHDADIGNIRDITESYSDSYARINNAITSVILTPDDAVRILKQEGITRIIQTDDEQYDDPYKYQFMASKLIQKTIDQGGIALWTVL